MDRAQKVREDSVLWRIHTLNVPHKRQNQSWLKVSRKRKGKHHNACPFFEHVGRFLPVAKQVF